MEYKYIKKFLGETWLKNQIIFIESQKWIKEGAMKKEDTNKIGFSVLEKIDSLIKKFEDVEGFSQWTLEARTSKSFEDCLFELMVLENLLRKSDKFFLKSENSLSACILEASIEKKGIFSYIECTKIKSIPESIQNRVKELFKKSSKKFRGSQGIHFVGVFSFFEYDGEIETPSPKLNLLIKLIEKRFERFGSSILAFVITHMFVAYNPNLNKSFFQKKYFIIPNPKKLKEIPEGFFEEILEVNETRII